MEEEDEASEDKFIDAKPVNKPVSKLMDNKDRDDEEQYETPRKRPKTNSGEMQ